MFHDLSQNIFSKLVYCRKHTSYETLKLKFCMRTQSHALGTQAKFQLEILNINVISHIAYFCEIILESSQNVSETTAWQSVGILMMLCWAIELTGGAVVSFEPRGAIHHHYIYMPSHQLMLTIIILMRTCMHFNINVLDTDHGDVFVKSSPPSATYMCQWIGSAMVQIMACRLFGIRPLSKAVLGYCELDH